MGCGAIALAQIPASSQPAAGTKPAMNLQSSRERAEKLLDLGVRYLLAAQQPDNGWKSDMGPGVTALVVRALARHPSVGPYHVSVSNAGEFIRSFQRDDGGVYSALGLFKNYETSVVVSALAALDPDRFDATLRKARDYLLQNQADEGEEKSVDDVWYGGAGYGFGRRPDLSNTQMMLDALRDSGLPQDDAAYRKALVFIARCQMLGEHNDQPFAKGATDGGFIYSAANGGESKAGFDTTDGRKTPRSYGSMTYAGFKSMLYCGVSKDDPRVKAAMDWIGRHWTLEHNPNMPERQSREGLYYYYVVFARALSAYGAPTVRDAHGREHDWRAELVEVLAKRQKPDGSWVNDADRWMEGEPALVTAYAMIALQEAFPELCIAPRAASQPTKKP